MKISRCLPLLPILLVLVAGCSKGSTTAAGGDAGPSSDGSYTFRVKPKAGETFTYLTKMSGAQNMEMTMTMSAKTVEADKVVFDSKITDMKMNGQPAPSQVMDIFKTMVMTNTMDGKGKPISTEVTGVPAQMAEQMKAQGSGNSTSFPDKAVKIGDTWTSEAVVNSKSVKMTYKLVRVETVNGKQAAILEATPDAGSDMKLTGPMVIAIEIANGMALNTKFSAEAQGQKISVEVARS